jgi:hypothetical protein
VAPRIIRDAEAFRLLFFPLSSPAAAALARLADREEFTGPGD